jgi:ribosomal-protein-alanine N-acetyltransferase
VNLQEDSVMVMLRKAKQADLAEVQELYEQSISLHHPWVYAPQDYESYLAQENRYFICLSANGRIVGTFNISGIVRGYFQSAYLGYEVFTPYQGNGYMSKGLTLLLEEAFENLNLHRLEANIQPENLASIRLVSNAGFIKEGFSKHYLKVGGLEWKDHERWAMLNNAWSELKHS